MESPPLLNHGDVSAAKKNRRNLCGVLWFLLAFLAIASIVFGDQFQGRSSSGEKRNNGRLEDNLPDIVESEQGVVAADDGRCSEIGAEILRLGGHAVDAAVATALCLGVVNPTSSGIGGGSFMLVRSSSTSQTQAFDMRETAPSGATEDMYARNASAKYSGALSMGVPGEVAGLHKAWSQHGRLAWSTLTQPAIKLAKDGFVISPVLGRRISNNEKQIRADPGLSRVYAPNGNLLRTGDTCYNLELARTLETVAEQGPQAFYNGTIGENLVKDVRDAGGILTMEDLRNYQVRVTDALAIHAMGYTIHGMPPPSSGTPGLALVLNILNGYPNSEGANGSLGLHRLIEALKHMFAIRMNLGDPYFVNVTESLSDMLSPSVAEQIRHMILDNTTFPPEYYLNRWSQLRDHGTSHFCIVDADRNAVSMTTTVNYVFGARVMSPSTGIVLNNEMGDFSTPTEVSPDTLPPAPTNFIRPNKRPLSSMTPIIITKDDQLVGVIGGSGGMSIIPAVVQVFLNHFVLGMEPLAAVLSPRVYHRLIPNVVRYENWTLIDGERIELPKEKQIFLEERGHRLEVTSGDSIVQLVVQTPRNPVEMGRKHGKYSTRKYYGTLTAVSDPRKNGKPAAV